VARNIAFLSRLRRKSLDTLWGVTDGSPQKLLELPREWNVHEFEKDHGAQIAAKIQGVK
jgi:hypothetical protein